MRWRRAAAVAIAALWAAVSLARLTRLVEPPTAAPGQQIVSTLPFLRAEIPPDGGYLYVLPGEFGTDTGTGPRLRYELFPRRYDDVRASLDEASARHIMTTEDLRYVAVPEAQLYPPTHWLRQASPGLAQHTLSPDTYVLDVAP